MIAHHRAARSAGRDDVVVILKILYELFRKLPRAVVIAVVEERLAAAGLGLREADVAAVMLEDPGDGDAHVRVELVGQASDEERDVVSHRRASLGRLQYSGATGMTRMGDLEDFGFWILDCGLVNQSIQNPQSKIQNRISHGTDIAVDWKMVLGKESLGAAVEYLRLLSSD